MIVFSLIPLKSLEKHLLTTSKTSSPDNLTIPSADFSGGVARATIVSNIRDINQKTPKGCLFIQRK